MAEPLEYAIGALGIALGSYLVYNWKDIRDWFAKNLGRKQEDKDEGNEEERNEEERNLAVIKKEGETKVVNFAEGLMRCIMEVVKGLDTETLKGLLNWVLSLNFIEGALFAGSVAVAAGTFTACVGSMELSLNPENLVMVKSCLSVIWMVHEHAHNDSISNGLEKSYTKERLAILVNDIYDMFVPSAER